MSDTEFDFEKALEAKFAALSEPEGTPAEEPEEEAAPVEEAVEEVDQEEVEEEQEEEQPRDDKGRFLPKFNDPDVQSFVEKHGGDLQKALKSAAHQESLVGRLGNEVGELRKLVEASVSRPQAAPIAPANLDELIEEDPQTVAVWALESNSPVVYEQALEAWYESDPRAAARFERALEIEELRRDLTSTVQPLVQNTQRQTVTQQLAQAQADLAGKHQDFAHIIATATDAELQGFPKDTLRLIQKGDYADQVSALEAVYRWVKAGRPNEATPTQEPPRPKKTKADSAVVTASSSPAREGKSGVEAFKEFLLEPDPTSTAAGRTH